MQIIELYIKGSTRLNGTAASTLSNNLIGENDSNFLTRVKVGDLVENRSTAHTTSVLSVVSDTQLTLASDIFIEGQNYRITNDFSRVDLFGDESVSITDSILNIRDISKVFSPFSQQFNLPASKHNNKLFKHYENTDVINSYDARYRSEAIIKLNGIDYKKGLVQFKSVKLKDNSPYSIQVIFYGDTVELKDLLGQNELSSLDFGTDLDFEYTETNVLNRFTNQDDISFPLITHSKNMRYGSDGYKDNITNTTLQYGDLKPAIKTYKIIEAITRTYPQLKFEQGFFNSVDFKKLYMWLHKNEGFITNADEGGSIKTLSNRFWNRPTVVSPNVDWDYQSSTGIGYDFRTATFFDGNYNAVRYKFILDITVIDQASEYTVFVKRGSDNSIFYQADFVGNAQLSKYIDGSFSADSEVNLFIEIQSENTLSLTQQLTVQREIKDDPRGWEDGGSSIYTPVNQSTSNTLIISEQMPKYKIIDFLSNLFKMFNLVVYKDGDNIKVETASYFSKSGVSFDITRYVDVSTSTVERLFQFKNMLFKFNSKKSFLVQYSDELQQNFFSRESYGNDEWDGGDYKVEVDFEKMMYERLSNENTGALSNIGQGAMLDKKFEPTIGKPLFLYIETTDSQGQFTLGNTTINNYNRPSQISPLDAFNGDRVSLNFGVEADEYEQDIVDNGDNLFNTGYLDYVETGFNIRSRLLKVSAYLPLGITTKYKMNDTFIIANKPYRINKIKTNLLTNKTDLELYSRLETVTEIENNQSAFLSRISNINVDSITNTSFVISYPTLQTEPNIVGYDFYINGAYRFTAPPNVGSIDANNTLEPDTSYIVDLRPKYLINGVNAYAFDTTVLIQTTNVI